MSQVQTSPSNRAIESSTLSATADIDPVPVIYTRSDRTLPLSVAQRALSVIVALGCLAVLVTAAWLRPDPNGFGTHQQLGLAPCAFKERTGLPCPSCGYTTAFSHFAHGHPLSSFYTQPMGAMLALATAMAVWLGLYVAITGRPVHRLLRLVPPAYYLMPLLALALLAWGWKVALVLMQHGS